MFSFSVAIAPAILLLSTLAAASPTPQLSTVTDPTKMVRVYAYGDNSCATQNGPELVVHADYSSVCNPLPNANGIKVITAGQTCTLEYFSTGSCSGSLGTFEIGDGEPVCMPVPFAKSYYVLC